MYRVNKYVILRYLIISLICVFTFLVIATNKTYAATGAIPIYDEEKTDTFTPNNISFSVEKDTLTTSGTGYITYGMNTSFTSKDNGILTVYFEGEDIRVDLIVEPNNYPTGVHAGKISEEVDTLQNGTKYTKTTHRLKAGKKYWIYLVSSTTKNKESKTTRAYAHYLYEHDFGDWKITKAPTYTEPGIHQKTCSGCNKVVSEEMPALEKSSLLSVTQNSYDLITGDKSDIFLTELSADAVQWESTDRKVVTIDSSNARKATIKATGEGEAKIVAFDSEGKGIECQVTVSLRQFSLSKASVTTGINRSFTLNVLGVDDIPWYSTDFKWKTSRNDIVKVEETNGFKQVKITPIGLGEVTLSVQDPYGATATCDVTVLNSYIELEQQNVVMQTRDEKKISAVSGSIASVESDNNLVSATCTQGSVTIKSGDKTGDSIITVTEKDGAKTTIAVTVNAITLVLDSDNVTINNNSRIVDYEIAKASSIIDEKKENEYTCYDGFAPLYSYSGEDDDEYYDDMDDLHQYNPYFRHYAIVNVYSGVIESVESSDTDVIQAECINDKIYLYSNKKLGSAEITVHDIYGDKRTIIVNVSFPFELSTNHIDIDCVPSKYSGLQIYSKNIIMKIVPQNTKVLKEFSYGKDYDYRKDYEPSGVGTTTVECTDIYGQKALFTVSVTRKYMDKRIASETDFSNIIYRNTIIGSTFPGAKVTIKIASKKYSKKANKKGDFTIPISYKVKNKAKLKYTIKYNGGSCSGGFKLYRQILETTGVARDMKRIRVGIEYEKKGDVITVKIGKKTYKKKIKKNNTDDNVHYFKLKVAKPKAKKIKITVRDKKGRIVGTATEKVYYASKVRKGMTKNQCKKTIGWGSPDSVSTYKGGTIWWYDDGSWLTFKGGRLVGWHY